MRKSKDMLGLMSDLLDRTCPITFRLLVVAALVVAGCSAERPRADGALDCDLETVWAEEGSVPEGTRGLAGAGEAVDAYLNPFLENHGGEIVMVTPIQGSLLVEGSEVVVGEASELPDGGFLVLAGAGCEGFDRSTG